MCGNENSALTHLLLYIYEFFGVGLAIFRSDMDKNMKFFKG
jgi:hypothetical protein